MLSRTSAFVLVVLILLPFSAPFATCDFEAMFPGTIRRGALSPTNGLTTPVRATLSPATSLEPRPHTPPLPCVAARTKLATSEARRLAPAAVPSKSPAYFGPVALGFVASPFVSPLRI